LAGDCKRPIVKSCCFYFAKQRLEIYDFFPHHFGAFSFMIQFDKNKLEDVGLFRSSEDFQLNTAPSYVEQLLPKD
jgi:hypothetical protein